MKHLRLDYYVGLLSAAGILGFAHQQPQQFQVMVSKQRDLSIGKRTNINCIIKQNINDDYFQKQKCTTGYFNIAKKETIVFDVIQYSHLCGYLNNIGTILYETGYDLNEIALANTALIYPRSIIQRLGYLLDLVGHADKTAKLHSVLQNNNIINYVKLSPSDVNTKHKDKKWHIIINAEVDMDL